MNQGNKTSKPSQFISFATCLFLALVLIVSACTPQTPISTPAPTVTLIRQSPAKTSTPYLTATPRPTATALPTFTPDTSTTLASEFDVPSACLINYLVSRDQNRIGADCNISREFIIVDKLFKTKVTISYHQIYDGDQTSVRMRPLSWSSDNRYLFFTTASRDGPFDLSFDTIGSLYQFDTEKETWSILIRAVSNPYYFFSNDGARFVFLNHYPLENSGFPEHLEVGMMDLASNRSKRVVFRNLWGPLYDELLFEWSDNNDKFAVVLYRPTFHPHEITFNAETLIIDFNKMDMELVQGSNKNNLLREN